VQERGDLVDVGDGANEPHGTVAARADGDIDGEHAREKRGPPDAGRRARLRQRGPRLPRPQAGGVEQHHLHGSCGERRGELRCNALAQVMMIREDAEVPHLVLPRRRNQANQSQGAVVVGEAAVGDERVQVHDQSEVASKALHDDHDTGVQAAHRAQRMVCSRPSPNRGHDRTGKHPSRAREQSRVVAQSRRHAPRERQHPLPIPDRG